MANRAQRRASKKLQNHPLIKEKVTQMAMDMSKMMFSQFEDVVKDLKDLKDEDEVITKSFTPEMSEEWKQKGKDMGEAVKEIAIKMQEQIKSDAKQLNLNNKNTIQYKLQASKRH